MTKIKGNRNIFVFSGIIVSFILISFIYFSPQLQRKTVEGHDLVTYKGGAKEINDYNKTSGEPTLWTNSMFGGMPAFLLNAPYSGNLFTKAFRVLNVIPRPAGYFVLIFSFFFLLLLLLDVNPWISFIGSLAFGFSTYFFVLFQAGHVAKVQALIYMALVISGVLYAYRKNSIVGSIIASVGLTWMLIASHPQITYYVAIMILIIGITYFIVAIKENALLGFIKTSLVLIIALILAIGVNFSKLYTTYEYGKYSTRGQSELKADADQTSGLDKSYILDYSYDLGETMTAFIPRFKGGGMAEPLGEDSHFYKELAKTQGKTRAKQIAENAPLYWGSQPISSAPFYYGAVLCFLFVFGLFMVKGKEKWWIVATVVISFVLSLGKYLPILSDFMIDYFPGYNKFRDVKNIIVIQQFAMALMGVLAIKEVYNRTINNKEFYRSLKWSFGIAGGLALIFALIPGLAGDFVGKSDAQYAQMGWPQSLIYALQLDRKTVLRADAFRTFIFVALAAAGLWAYWTKKVKAQYALVFWAVLILADMWPIDKRYLNNDDFVAKRKAETPFTPSQADLEILKDKSLDYRVLNLAVNPWSDASTSYFHKSIGGYHGAKMGRYQDMIEHHLSPEIQQLSSRLRNVKSQADVEAVFEGLNGINMLNTKYIIFNPKTGPLVNSHALGNAWFVNNYKVVADANEEIDQIEEVDVAKTAIVDQRFEKLLPTEITMDSTATIKLQSYAPNKLVYKTSAKTEQLAVFSEIYYPKGWYAYIDGKEMSIFRADYILRAMMIPAGNHEITFEFKPKSYEVGNKISFASSLIMLLAIAGVVFVEIKKRWNSKKNEE